MTGGSQDRLHIYIDGACEPNPGSGAWAFVIPHLGIERSGEVPDTTNNRMELEGIRQTLLFMDPSERLLIFTDSMLSVRVLTKKWKAKKNRDLIEAIWALSRGRSSRLAWVRGHASNLGNERADQLADQALAGTIVQDEDACDPLTDEWRAIVGDCAAGAR